MSKTLELVFRNAQGRLTRINVNNPQEPVDAEAVGAAMDVLLAGDVFQHGGGLVEKVGARLVERTVQDIDLV